MIPVTGGLGMISAHTAGTRTVAARSRPSSPDRSPSRLILLMSVSMDGFAVRFRGAYLEIDCRTGR